MSNTAKWAFERKPDAEAFIQANGGKLATFDEALHETTAEIGPDKKMNHKEKGMHMMKH